ncbi:MAG: hypothetical protein DLM56_04540 [Pseudonocardiales bacterium]|nr:MAG: hypothetical protein DLM56_04540 [Pseudonocardiales bacterium]
MPDVDHAEGPQRLPDDRGDNRARSAVGTDRSRAVAMRNASTNTAALITTDEASARIFRIGPSEPDVPRMR